MPESEAYYEEILYPLQNGVLSALANCDAPFYLTGGTALHRHYFGDRYSDDLDLFLNRDSDFAAHVRRALAGLRRRGYPTEVGAGSPDRDYARVVVRRPEAALTLDFVNDTAPRFGEIVSGTLHPRIDSLRNILSNKVTALSRLEAKDVADLWAICRRLAFNWSAVLDEARQKDMGVGAENTADLLRSFPDSLFDNVGWRRRPDRDQFLADLGQMSRDLIEVGPNSLAAPPPGSGAD